MVAGMYVPIMCANGYTCNVQSCIAIDHNFIVQIYDLVYTNPVVEMSAGTIIFDIVL